jgi:hypothetical protein
MIEHGIHAPRIFGAELATELARYRLLRRSRGKTCRRLWHEVPCVRFATGTHAAFKAGSSALRQSSASVDMQGNRDSLFEQAEIS